MLWSLLPLNRRRLRCPSMYQDKYFLSVMQSSCISSLFICKQFGLYRVIYGQCVCAYLLKPLREVSVGEWGLINFFQLWKVNVCCCEMLIIGLTVIFFLYQWFSRRQFEFNVNSFFFILNDLFHNNWVFHLPDLAKGVPEQNMTPAPTLQCDWSRALASWLSWWTAKPTPWDLPILFEYDRQMMCATPGKCTKSSVSLGGRVSGS